MYSRTPSPAYEARGAWVHDNSWCQERSQEDSRSRWAGYILVPRRQHFHRCDGACNYNFLDVLESASGEDGDRGDEAAQAGSSHEAIGYVPTQATLGLPLAKSSTSQNDEKSHARRTEFLDLPLELRKLVYGYLVQTKCTFYFSILDYPAGRDGKHTATVTKIMPLGSPVHDRVSSLFAVNQQIQDECYTMLYGEDTFMFREASPSINETVFLTNHSSKLDIWTKVFKDLTPGPLWPLTSSTLPYLRMIKLLVFPWDGAHATNFKNTKRSITHPARLLSRCHELRSLDITLSLRRDTASVTRYRGQPISVLTELAHDMSIFVDDTTGRISVEPVKRGFSWLSTPEQKQYVLEPLAQLYGIKNVTIGGFVEPEFAMRLSSVMMCDERVDIPASPAVGATRLVRRKRPGRTTKTLTKQKVLQYWEPTLGWEAIDLVNS